MFCINLAMNVMCKDTMLCPEQIKEIFQNKIPNEIEIGIVGGGNIGFAIGTALIRKRVVMTKNLFVSCPHLESHEKWRRIGVPVTCSNGDVVKKCEIIFICVEPNVVQKCALEIEMSIEPAVCGSDKVFISVSSGVTLNALVLVS